jgi:short-subunit dehydrogenase
MTSSAQPDVSAIDPQHLLVIGAGPGIGGAVARRFAEGGYRVTLMARSTDNLSGLASDVASTGAEVDTVAGDAGDPDGLRATLTSLYAAGGAPGLMVYNAAMAVLDSLLDTDPDHLRQAYNVDVVSAIVATQVASAAMRADGGGTILFTGGGFADHPIPTLASISLGKAALRSAGTMLGSDLADSGVRVATVTVDGVVKEGTPFSTDRIAEKFWTVAQTDDGNWQSEFRYEGTL